MISPPGACCIVYQAAGNAALLWQFLWQVLWASCKIFGLKRFSWGGQDGHRWYQNSGVLMCNDFGMLWLSPECHLWSQYNPVVWCRVCLLGDTEVVAVSPVSAMQYSRYCRSAFWQYLSTSSSIVQENSSFFEYFSNAGAPLHFYGFGEGGTLNHSSRASFCFTESEKSHRVPEPAFSLCYIAHIMRAAGDKPSGQHCHLWICRADDI